MIYPIGMTITPEELTYDMKEYFNKYGAKLLYTLNDGTKVKGCVSRCYNEYIHWVELGKFGKEVSRSQIDSIELLSCWD